MILFKKIICIALLFVEVCYGLVIYICDAFPYTSLAIFLNDDEIQEELLDQEMNHVNLYNNHEGKNEPILLAFCFHEVGYSKNTLSIEPKTFKAMLRELKQKNFTFLDVNDIIAIKNGQMKQPQRGAFIGFDDGYEDIYTYAYPILKEEGAKATFFLVAKTLSRPNRLSYAQVREMLDHGMGIGSHTVNHIDLDTLQPDEIFRELNDSKYDLQNAFDIPVEAVAYPCGSKNEAVFVETKKVYTIGFTASMDQKVPNTSMAIHRYGVFQWNHSINSILKNKRLCHNKWLILTRNSV